MDPLRISDDDREAAVRALGEQYAEGRLTKDEFDERSDAAWSARTRSDLGPLFEDLPVRTPAQPSFAGDRTVPARGSVRHARGRGFPLVPVIFLLVAITVVTKLPFLLLAVGLWFLLGRCRPLSGQRSGSRFADRGSCS
jgi:hypothetical protein